jgi:hypothetical protein
MIYYLNKESGEFLQLDKNRKKPESVIQPDGGYYGSNMIVMPPIDYYTLKEYSKNSETHLGALNFKIRNIAEKGFTLNNMKDSISAIRKLEMVANANGETLHDVMYQAIFEWVHTGNIFFEVVGIGTNVAIYKVSADYVYGVLNKYGSYIDKYQFLTGAGNLVIPAKKGELSAFRYIKHIKRPNIYTQFFGVPDWYSLATLQSIDVIYGLDEWLEKFISNNARFDFLIVTEGEELTNDEKTALRAALSANKGSSEKGKGGYLGVGFDTQVKVIELNKVDHSGILKTKVDFEQQILQAHGLSAQSVGISNGGKSIAGNEAIGALRTDYESNIKPEQLFLANQINAMFYEIFKVDPQLTFMPMDVVSEKEKAVIADVYIKSGVASKSYFRRKLFPDMTDEEIKEANEVTETDGKINFQEKPDAFDDTQSYERADRR